MHDSIKAKSHIPQIYKGFVEMETIVDTDDILMDKAESEIKNLTDNQWLSTMDENGVAQWEQMLRIVADPALEDLEFRRNRIINRVSSRIPFTELSLKQKLDSIIGAGNYILTIDNNQYIIYLESSATNQVWHSEIMLTMNNMKPCNMRFINTPFVSTGIGLEETVNYSQVIHNYTLGSGFQLGMRSFMTFVNEVVVKLANTASISPAFTSNIAKFAAGDVASVLINDTVSISTFTTKVATENTVTVSYEVTAEQADEITSVKLLDSKGSVLTSAAVYVPVTNSVLMKHTILVKEG